MKDPAIVWSIYWEKWVMINVQCHCQLTEAAAERSSRICSDVFPNVLKKVIEFKIPNKLPKPLEVPAE